MTTDSRREGVMTITNPEHAEPGVYETPGKDGAAIDWVVVPWSMGPTWDMDPSWTGPRDPNGFILPHYTLGYQAIKWVQDNLLDDESDEDTEVPFKLTAEQARFILWFYAINEHGHFAYREVVLQRLKGWG